MVQLLVSKGWRGMAIPLLALLFALTFYLGQASVTPQSASASSGNAAALAAPSLSTPANAATGVTLPVALSWNAVASASNYVIQLSTDSGFASATTVSQAVATTSLTVSYLKNSTTYYWRVMALSGSPNTGAAPAYSAWSTAWSFTTVAPPPPPPAPIAPTLLAPANGATGVTLPVTLSWNASASATNYMLQLSQGSAFAATATICQLVQSTTVKAPQLQSSTTYYWRVQAATSTAGKGTPDTHAAPGAQSAASAWSATWSFTTTAPPPPPPAPLAPTLLAPANGVTGVTLPVQLSWNASSSATNYYMVQFSTGADFASTATAAQLVKATSLTLPPVQYNTTYYWRVMALSSTANAGPSSTNASPWSAAWSFTTTAPPPPPPAPLAPTLLAPANNATGITLPVQLSWNAVSNAMAYLVQFSPNADFAVTATNSQLVKTTALTIPQLPASTTFYWRVTALAGGATPANTASSTTASPWSAAWNFTTAAPPPPPPAPAAPTLLTPANGATGVTQPVQLSWNAVTGAAVYFVEIGSDAAFDNNALFGPVKATTLTLPAQTSSAPIYWRVKAVVTVTPPGPPITPSSTAGGTVQTAWSAAWSFTIVAPTPPPALTAPTLLAPTNAATGVTLPVTLSWDAVSNAGCYTVQISTGADFAASATNSQMVISTTLVIPMLPAGTFYWRVAAVSGVAIPVISAQAGSTTPPAIGPWSSVWSFTTVATTPPTPPQAPPAPTLLAPDNGAADVPQPVQLSWDAVPGAVYYVEIGTDDTFASTTLLGPLKDTQLQLTTLKSITPYYWRVKAVIPVATPGTSASTTTVVASPWSDIWSFTPSD